MSKRTKLQNIFNVLTANEGKLDFVEFDNQIAELKEKLKENVQIKTLDDINYQVDKFRKSVNLAPLVATVTKTQDLLKQKREAISGDFEKLRKDIDSKSTEMNSLVSRHEKEAGSRVKDLQTEISNLTKQLSSLEEVHKGELESIDGEVSTLKKSLANLTDLEARMDESFLELSEKVSALEDVDIPEDKTKYFEDKIDKLKREIMSSLSGLGGGSMNRKITVEGVDVLTKYTDINLYGTSSSIITSVDDVKKVVNIGIQGGGGGAGNPSAPDMSVQFNDGGNFGGDANLTWNKTLATLTFNGNGFIQGDANYVSIINPSGGPFQGIYLDPSDISFVTDSGEPFKFSSDSGANYAILDTSYLFGGGDETFAFPNQSGTIASPVSVLAAGMYLQTLGGGLSQWASVITGAGNPAGATTEVQFNDGGVFGASSVLAFNKNTSIFTVGRGMTVFGNTVNNTRPIDVTNATQLNGVKITATSSIAASRSVGGQLLVSNGTVNTGNAAVFYSNVASALGRIVHITADDVSFDKEALFVESDSNSTTTVGIRGNNNSQGTVKVTQVGTGTDANAAVLSLDMAGAGTAAQGIFIDATGGGTTGALLNVRNNGAQKFYVNPSGHTSVYGTLVVGEVGAINGRVDIAGTTAGFVRVQTASTAGNWTLTLPPNDGNANQVLTTDGNGITAWASVAATGGSGITRTSSIVSISSTFGAANATDYVAFANVGIALTLPTAVGNLNMYTVKNVSASSVLVKPTGAETIDGSASALIAVPNVSLDFLSDNTNWNVI